MTKKKTAALVIIVLVVIAGLALVYAHPKTPKADITLGAPFLLSGDFAPYGEHAHDAITLAVEDFKKTHPNVSVNVIFEDTHGDPKQTLSSYRKLVDVDHVDAVVGPMLQTEMSTIEPAVATDQVPIFSIAPVPLEKRGLSPNPFALWPDPTREAEQMAQYVYDQGIRRIALLGTEDAWETEVTRAFAAKFTALGGTVTHTELTLIDSKDDRVTLAKTLATKPEAIFFGTYYKFFDFVKTARELGFTGKFYSIEIDTSLADQTKGLSDGLQFISPNFYTTDFTNRYKAKFGTEPTLPAGQAYDATMLALTMLNQAHENRAQVLAAMREIKMYNGVSGTIHFDNYRATFPLSIFEINHGAISKVE